MSDFSIEGLVADLKPVRTVNPRLGMSLILLTTGLAVTWVALWYGLRPDILAGHPHPMVVLRAGALLLLGTACAVAVTSAAKPAVGHRQSGWIWALAGALLFPLAALLTAPWATGFDPELLAFEKGRYCLQLSGLSALGIGFVLTQWLRRGAPTHVERAGWLVGLSAGCFGTFAYSLHCPLANIWYIGFWYTLAVGLCAVAGRLIVPRLIRW